MPVVQLYQNRTVAPRAALQSDMTVRASAEAFGADIGRGLQSVARGVGHISDVVTEVQIREDEARAKEADVQFADWTRAELHDPERGLLNIQGQAAVDARVGFEERLRAKRGEIAATLNPRAADMFGRAATARESSALDSAIRHAAAERKQWITGAAMARAGTFQNDALANYQDDKAVKKNIAAGVLELRTVAADQGWSPDELQAKEQEFVSGTLKNVVLALAGDDPIAANDYLQANRDRFTGADQVKLDGALKPAIKEAEAKRAVGDVIQRAQAGEFGAGEATGEGYVAVGAAASLLRGFEGFRSVPYWDVNANRVGYGSDTITRADGSVVRVTAGARVSREDAERDLERRVKEFQSGIVRQVGMKTWLSLPAGAQAALTSVAYNYGSLPFSVASAVVTGDVNAIATAVEGLKGHNNGVNSGRRQKEADVIRGAPIESTPGGAAGGGGGLSYSSMMAALATIEDPDVREMARKQLSSMLELSSKAREEEERAAKAELWRMIDMGQTPDQVPFEVRQAAGMAAVQSAWSYVEESAKRADIETDESTLYALRLDAARDPKAFADVDLNDYRDKLSKQDIRTLADLQASAINDERKARGDASAYSEAFRLGEQALEAVGITTTGLTGNQRMEAAKRTARFQNALVDLYEEFKTENNRNPNPVEIRSMVNRLMLPIVIKQPGMLYDSEDEGFVFDAPIRPDGSSVDVRVEYGDIPIDLRAGIARNLELELGRKPTPDEVVQRYEEFVLSD